MHTEFCVDNLRSDCMKHTHITEGYYLSRHCRSRLMKCPVVRIRSRPFVYVTMNLVPHQLIELDVMP
jgi:hypothetical protein